VKRDLEITRMIFRTFKEGDVIAIMPDLSYGLSGLCESYQRIGQHGGADYLSVMKSTRAATDAEIKPLLMELEGLGYNVKIAKRR